MTITVNYKLNLCVDVLQSSVVVPNDKSVTYTIGDPLEVVSMPSGFRASLNGCGSVTQTVSGGMTEAVSYSAQSGSLSIFTEDESLRDTQVQIIVNSYLTKYPTISGKTVLVRVSLEINPCADPLQNWINVPSDL